MRARAAGHVPGPAPAGRGGPPARLAGTRKSRDAAAIAHHYDVSNRFYELVLGPSMAYTCAVYPDPDATLEQAQEEKFDLVCRKLGLQPGHAAAGRGLRLGRDGPACRRALRRHAHSGVTLSRAAGRSGAEGRSRRPASPDRAEIRHSDYRDVTESGFDAVSSIGLTEHIGKAQPGPPTSRSWPTGCARRAGC